MKKLNQKGIFILDYLAVIAILLAILAIYPDLSWAVFDVIAHVIEHLGVLFEDFVESLPAII